MPHRAVPGAPAPGLARGGRGPRLRPFVAHGTATAGAAQGARVRRWLHAKNAGGEAGLAAPRLPVTSTLLAHAHNAIDRKLGLRTACPHPDGHQQAWLPGLAHLSTRSPDQRRAWPAGQGGGEVAGGRLPTAAGMRHLHLLTAGG